METSIAAPRRSWLRAHWKAIVCVWVGLGVFGAIWAFAIMRTTDAAKLAISTAQTSPVLALQLGQPLKTGWFISGSVEITPASGHAELTIPISGPKGAGTLYAEAHKRAGLWALDLLQFGKKGSDNRLDLLSDDSGKSSPLQP